ncbi:MAG: cation-transporting P-type ATPase [Methanomicrobiales archaeon]|nr:cation-transporting P-type ATPase [Methanomicrobiales archaeon]MDI6875817.1 cation-transporting P-type ATPase [Methanomicrobiales archaeon]
MDMYALPREEVLARSGTRESGLTGDEAERRLAEYGFNEIERRQKKNYLAAYGRQYTSFFAILLEAAAALAFVAHLASPQEGYDILGFAIVAVVIVNASFAFWQEYKAEKTVEALMRLLPALVTVRRDGVPAKVEARRVVPGDLLLLDEGDKIAADAVLIEANSLYVNMATLTGESRPVRRTAGPEPREQILDARNVAFAGTTVTSGNGVGVVFATGKDTQFGRIATLTETVARRRTPMELELARMTRVFTLIALTIGAVFFALAVLFGRGLFLASIFALALIVANIPEGMLPTVTLSLSLASQNMAKRNALVKNLDAVQTLGSATVILTDKTGTLTRSEMTLREIYLTSGEEITVSGEGYFQGGEFHFRKELKGSKERLQLCLISGMLDCRARIEDSMVFGDPTELAIVAAAHKAEIGESGYIRTGEIPFTSERKMMSTIYARNAQKYIFSKGAPEVILGISRYYIDADSQVKELDEARRTTILRRAEEFEKRAYRVLAIAYQRGEEEADLIVLGLVAFMDVPRGEVGEAIAKCRTAGVRVMILTGDSPFTAMAIAEQIGLPVDQTITGDQILAYSDEELGELLKTRDILFARVPSDQKLRIAGILQKNGEIVAMTGDGVNDAPALKRADIGVAMGIRGTEVAKEAADIVLLDDNFASIVAAIEEGRTVYFNIKKFVTYILSSNMPEIVPYILWFFLAIPLPLAVIQVLAIDLGTDLVPALALGAEQAEEDIMDRPPVGQTERILDREVFKRGYGFLGIIEATAAMTGFFALLFLQGWQYGDLAVSGTVLHRQAMTMTLLGAIFCQIANAWTLRAWEHPSFGRGLSSNRLLVYGIALEIVLVLLFLFVEPIQFVFSTAFVPYPYLLILVPFPVLLYAGHEIYKALKRRQERERRLSPLAAEAGGVRRGKESRRGETAADQA